MSVPPHTERWRNALFCWKSWFAFWLGGPDITSLFQPSTVSVFPFKLPIYFSTGPSLDRFRCIRNG